MPDADPPAVVPPDATPPASSALRDGGDNVVDVTVQDLCPGRPVEHLTLGTSDAVGYALTVDALDRAGPVAPRAFDRVVCLQPFQPGVDPATFPTDFAALSATVAQQVATYPRVPAEPPLMPYVAQSTRHHV